MDGWMGGGGGGGALVAAARGCIYTLETLY